MNVHRGYATLLLRGVISVVAFFVSTLVHSKSIPMINADKSYQFTTDRMPDPVYNYISQKGVAYQLTPWVGQYVVILTRNRNLNRRTMETILRAVDSAYVFYRELTGRTPNTAPWARQYDGRFAIARVPPPEPECGYACTYFGYFGTEVSDYVFDALYRQASLKDPKLDQAVFYELGRAFWFYEDQLTFYEKSEAKVNQRGEIVTDNKGEIVVKERSPFSTAFAILNKFLSMQAASLAGAPISTCPPKSCDKPFNQFRIDTLDTTFHAYAINKTYNWRNTIEMEVKPMPSPEYLGYGDFVASILNKINTDGGFEAAQRFWQTIGRLPPSHSPEEAMTNFLRAGKAATGKDYRGLLRDETLPRP